MLAERLMLADGWVPATPAGYERCAGSGCTRILAGCLKTNPCFLYSQQPPL